VRWTLPVARLLLSLARGGVASDPRDRLPYVRQRVNSVRQLPVVDTRVNMRASMAIELPYMPTVKNVPVVFDKIAKAKVPDAFTTNYLTGTLGLKSTNDRALIPLLKKLGFLDGSGKPTTEYSRLKNKDRARKSIAAGIRKGYAALYGCTQPTNLPTSCRRIN